MIFGKYSFCVGHILLTLLLCTSNFVQNSQGPKFEGSDTLNANYAVEQKPDSNDTRNKTDNINSYTINDSIKVIVDTLGTLCPQDSSIYYATTTSVKPFRKATFRIYRLNKNDTIVIGEKEVECNIIVGQLKAVESFDGDECKDVLFEYGYAGYESILFFFGTEKNEIKLLSIFDGDVGGLTLQVFNLPGPYFFSFEYYKWGPYISRLYRVTNSSSIIKEREIRFDFSDNFKEGPSRLHWIIKNDTVSIPGNSEIKRNDIDFPLYGIEFPELHDDSLMKAFWKKHIE